MRRVTNRPTGVRRGAVAGRRPDRTARRSETKLVAHPLSARQRLAHPTRLQGQLRLVNNLDKFVNSTDSSSMAQVTITPEALNRAARLPLPMQGRIRRLILRLQAWPAVSGAKPLSYGSQLKTAQLANRLNPKRAFVLDR